jgi:hypothetical protein
MDTDEAELIKDNGHIASDRSQLQSCSDDETCPMGLSANKGSSTDTHRNTWREEPHPEAHDVQEVASSSHNDTTPSAPSS